MEDADRYAEVRARSRVHDRPLFALPPTFSELELQARWFAGDFGREFTTIENEVVRIVDFGFWNREAGPDFREAVIELGKGPSIRGAIELDLADRNWELHRHATNPAFEETVLHLFFERKPGGKFFTRTRANRLVPQVLLDPELSGKPLHQGVPLAHPGRCVGPLSQFDDTKVGTILNGAAEFRLRRKAERLRRRIAAHGRDNALYQALADALGYKHNRLPFSLVAQRLPLKEVRPPDGEALLFGVAGFLHTGPSPSCGAPARLYLRRLWDQWWKQREKYSRLVLPREAWKMSGGRPLNHPHRRLGALAVLTATWEEVSASFGDETECDRVLSKLRHKFWQSHYSLKATEIAKPQALIGPSRRADILANVYHPLSLVERRFDSKKYGALRAELSNRALAIAGARLFADPRRAGKFLKTIAGQQGLLQIYEDFCQRDLSDCARCPFPEQILRW